MRRGSIESQKTIRACRKRMQNGQSLPYKRHKDSEMKLATSISKMGGNIFHRQLMKLKMFGRMMQELRELSLYETDYTVL